MSFYGKTETWKVIYIPKDFTTATKGVALIEAPDKHWAIHTFMEQYAGQYTVIDTCTKLFE